MLDASKRPSEFRSPTSHDSTLCQTAENLHFSAAYEKSRLRTVPRFQRNFVSINAADFAYVRVR